MSEPEEPLDLNPEEDLRSLLRDIRSLQPVGLDYASRLYALFKKYLRIDKGMVLVPDSSGSRFTPWAGSGLDLTTERRFRLPSSLVHELFLPERVSAVVRRRKEIGVLEAYLSSREWGLVEKIALGALQHRSECTALLCILDSPYLRHVSGTFTLMLTAAVEAASSALSNAPCPVRMPAPASARETFSRLAEDLYARAAQGEGFFFAGRIPIGRLVELVKRENSDIDEYRVFRDLVAYLAALIQGSPLYADKERRELYFARLASSASTDLFVHQLTIAVKKMFRDLGSLDGLGAALFSYPEDGVSFAEIHQKLFG